MASAIEQVNEVVVLHGFIDLLIHHFTTVLPVSLSALHCYQPTQGISYCQTQRKCSIVTLFSQSKSIIIRSNYCKNNSNLVLKCT